MDGFGSVQFGPIRQWFGLGFTKFGFGSGLTTYEPTSAAPLPSSAKQVPESDIASYPPLQPSYRTTQSPGRITKALTPRSISLKRLAISDPPNCHSRISRHRLAQAETSGSPRQSFATGLVVS